MRLGPLALGLLGDLFQLAALHGRQGLARPALFGVGEGAAVGLHPFADRIEELALPFGQGDASLLGRPFGAFQGVDRRTLGGLALGLERAGRRPDGKRSARAAFDASPDVLTSSAQGRLRTIIERLERLEEDKQAVMTDMKEVFAEAKGEGYDVKTLRKVIRIRKQDKAKRQEEEAILDLYLSALGEV